METRVPGHHSPAFTLSVYVHLMDDDRPGKRLASSAQVIGAARRDCAFDVARPPRTIYPVITPDPI